MGFWLAPQSFESKTTDENSHISRSAYEITRMDASSHRICGSGGVGRVKYGPGIRMRIREMRWHPQSTAPTRHRIQSYFTPRDYEVTIISIRVSRREEIQRDIIYLNTITIRDSLKPSKVPQTRTWRQTRNYALNLIWDLICLTHTRGHWELCHNRLR